MACIVIEKGFEKVVEKSAEEWLNYYRKGNGNDKGKSPNEAKPDHADAPTNGITALLNKRGPQGQKKQDDKKVTPDSTTKKP